MSDQTHANEHQWGVPSHHFSSIESYPGASRQGVSVPNLVEIDELPD